MNEDKKKSENQKFDDEHSREIMFNRILSKYLSVWIWSALFGGSSGLFYFVVNTNMNERYGIISRIGFIMAIFAGAFVVLSYANLYLFLKKHIIPGLIIQEDRIFEVEILKRNVQHLSLSFYWMILGMLFKISYEVMKLLFNSLM